MSEQWLVLSGDISYIMDYPTLRASIQLTYSKLRPDEWTYTETSTCITTSRNGKCEITATPLSKNIFLHPVHF